MRIEQIEKIIRTLKDCECPTYENDRKLWKMEVERSITYLEFELQTRRISNRKRYKKTI